ncbi:acyltransferase domain-containing protein [Amycolatopsis roodepoortensis]|uniref:type I polyketide synthase n=1 Tax=Amycolatopsis roodepoortensis TaxID=700274 RepID=UPI00214B1D6B|nr:type I polyketide synthase [Amycolatopsis roodepoortensis]UUV31601.1 acyltransferase domain-containing protein [Amycolatopsis roodepoortensis]
MERDRSLDLAVTGMAIRVPGAADLAAWWAALLDGRTLTTRLTRDELSEAGVPADLADDPDYVPVRGRLADADRFDNTLLRVGARDAELMDPQHRLMLEVAWEAMEDAGACRPGGDRVTAVFASGSGSGYLRTMLANGPLDPQTLDQAIHGTDPDFIASLVSYKLGLTGLAVGVQTACSSSLVGLHLAGQALLNGDCDQAVVVAAGIDFPQGGHLHVPGGIQSASGDCRPFDENADGVVAGSGVAAVVLRRLSDVLDDGPQPHGVILGSAVNNDGMAKVGYYAPSAAGQEAVIRAALAAADVEAESLGYLEAHATGTRVGDPIEWSAASAALSGMGAVPGQVAVGALKANIGHLDSASGLASLIKTMLVLRDGLVPPVAGFTRLNPLLEPEDSPLYVPTTCEKWSGPEPRRAGVSSFGIGGTNAHVVLEQAPVLAADGADVDVDRLVVLSAADAGALTRSAGRLATFLSAERPPAGDVSFTLAAGRAELAHRLAVAGRDPLELAERLTSGSGVVRAERPAEGGAPVVFLFPGQGTQRPGMAAAFADALPGFGEVLERCLDAFAPPLAERVRAALSDPGFPATELAATDLAQPALFAVEYAAAVGLSELGVEPVALAGHSLGEITAACFAGIFDLRSAARFVAARGLAMHQCPQGTMLALGCDGETAMALAVEAGADVELASANGPDSCVLAGASDEVAAFRRFLGDRVHAKVLHTSHAFHTKLIEPALPALARELAGVKFGSPRLPLVSNRTGELLDPGAVIGPRDYVEQARHPVRFGDGLAAIARRFPGALLVEVGPGRALSGLAEAVGLATVPLSAQRTPAPGREVLGALGELWVRGQPLAITSVCADGRRIHLPGYPFGGPRWMAPELGRKPVTAEEPAPETPDTAPPGPAELLTALWQELLGTPEVGAESDFFELGGDSLLITHLARRVHQRLGVRVPLRAMLAGRTLGRQIAVLTESLRRAEPPGGPAVAPGPNTASDHRRRSCDVLVATE